MTDLHVNTLPTWVECFHKNNKEKVYLHKRTKDVDYYKFAIYRNAKYENLDAYVAGFFYFDGHKLLIDRYLFKVEGIYFDETYHKLVQEYNRLKEQGAFVPTHCLEEEQWTGHSPYDH